MVSMIKYLAIASVIALTTASGAFAQERGGLEQNGIKLPSSNGGGGGRPGRLLGVTGGDVQYGGPRLEFPTPFPTPRPVSGADDFINGVDDFIHVMPVEDSNDKPEGGSETTSPKDGWGIGTPDPNNLLKYPFDGHSYSGVSPSDLGTRHVPSPVSPPIIANSLDWSGWNGKCWVWEGVCY